MPLVTFRCADSNCDEQVTVRLKSLFRRLNKPDVMRPHPTHHHLSMVPIQIDYWKDDS